MKSLFSTSCLISVKSLQFLPYCSFSRRLHNLFAKHAEHKKCEDHKHDHHHHHHEQKSIKTGIAGVADHEEELIKKIIEGNKNFSKEKLESNPNYFKELSKTQHPDYFFISCSDSRVPPTDIIKTEPGELFVHRNIANQCKRSDLNCQSALFYAVEVLKVKHVIVLGHTHCGGIAAAAKNQSLGIVDLWLQNVRDIAVSHREELGKLKEEKDFLTRLSELNVRHQVLNVCKSAVVQKAWSEKRYLRVSGWLFDIETGLIKDLDVTQKEWEEIKKFFQFSFEEHH